MLGMFDMPLMGMPPMLELPEACVFDCAKAGVANINKNTNARARMQGMARWE